MPNTINTKHMQKPQMNRNPKIQNSKTESNKFVNNFVKPSPAPSNRQLQRKYFSENFFYNLLPLPGTKKVETYFFENQVN